MIKNSWILIIIMMLITPAYAFNIEVVTEQYPPFNYRKEGVVKGVATEKVKAVLPQAELEEFPELKVKFMDPTIFVAFDREIVLIENDEINYKNAVNSTYGYYGVQIKLCLSLNTN